MDTEAFDHLLLLRTQTDVGPRQSSEIVASVEYGKTGRPPLLHYVRFGKYRLVDYLVEPQLQQSLPHFLDEIVQYVRRALRGRLFYPTQVVDTPVIKQFTAVFPRLFEAFFFDSQYFARWNLFQNSSLQARATQLALYGPASPMALQTPQHDYT